MRVTDPIYIFVTSQIYAWPLLESLFSEVLTRDEWLRLFDNIFSNRPIMLLYVVVAYCTCNRRPLLQCTDIDDFKVTPAAAKRRETNLHTFP